MFDDGFSYALQDEDGGLKYQLIGPIDHAFLHGFERIVESDPVVFEELE
jgi:hypothetical protein